MAISSIIRSADKATRLIEEAEDEIKKIEEELKKISGIDTIIVSDLPGDGIGVCLNENGNCESAVLDDVLTIIRERGTFTRDEILSITCL